MELWQTHQAHRRVRNTETKEAGLADTILFISVSLQYIKYRNKESDKNEKAREEKTKE